MGVKGKFTKLKNYQTVLDNHYSDTGLTFTLKMTKTKGDTCRISINNTNAVAGVSELNGNSIRPSKNECGEIASTAHDLAEKHVEENGGDMPRKAVSGGDVYGA